MPYLLLQEADHEGDEVTVLLPTREVPVDAEVGTVLSVFLYRDSEDRPIATTNDPILVVGEVGFLKVSDITRVGAFFDFGLARDLLVPFAEQTRELQVGDREAIGLFVDHTGRLAGTMKVSQMLGDIGEFTVGEWVQGEAWRRDPELGVFVIVERRFVGLIPASEPTKLGRGETCKLRVQRVLADGKIELSMRAPLAEQLDTDAEHVLATLRAKKLAVGDHTDPDEIRAVFQLSKKAFKRAAGRLLKQGRVKLDDNDCLVIIDATPEAEAT